MATRPDLNLITIDPRSAHRQKPPVPVDGSSFRPSGLDRCRHDIRAFLQKGVPAALTRAALRRAWSSDPAIRDFIEMAENQWDFSHPDSIAGFGALNAGDNVPELVAKALGEWGDRSRPAGENSLADTSAASAPPTGCEAISSTPSARVRPEQPSSPGVEERRGRHATAGASQQLRCDAAEGAPPRPRARHGSALPS